MKTINIENDEWVATTDAASIVGLCSVQFWRLQKAGKLKVKRLKIGTMTLYNKADLEQAREDYEFHKRNG